MVSGLRCQGVDRVRSVMSLISRHTSLSEEFERYLSRITPSRTTTNTQTQVRLLDGELEETEERGGRIDECVCGAVSEDQERMYG